MNPVNGSLSWFSREQQAAVDDFWAVYDANYDSIVAATMRMADAHPEFGAMVRAMPPEQLAAQNVDSRRRLREAIAGDWAQYESNLREQGAIYAKLGVSFAGWYDLVRAFHADLVPRLVETYGSSLGRLTASLLALQEFADRAMVTIGEAYLDAKQREVVRVQERNRELEARAVKTALRESEERFRLFVQNVKDHAILTLDIDGRVVSWNVGGERIKGYSADDVMGAHFSRFYPAEDAAAGVPERELGIAAAEGRFEHEGWRVRKDGSRFWANVVVTAIRDAAGTVTGFGSVTRDFTERKAIEQNLRDSEERSRNISVELAKQVHRVNEASRLKSEFLASMSHELRTPLNSIIGFADLLHDGEVDPASPEHHEFLGDILKSGRHLLQLINDVLDLSKVEAGRLEFHPESVHLQTLVQEIASILRTAITSKRLRIHIDVDPSLTDLSIDPARLKQVLYNYLSNAQKFSSEGGAISIRAMSEGPDAFRLEVEDSGIGIAAEDIPRLFVEFQQLDAGAAKRHGGTGLGLALTKRLVEAQGGSVGVRSTLGSGSVFHVVLPRKALGGSPLPQPTVIAGSHRDAPRVLVIEDDPRDQSMIVRVLSEAGYSVETAATGAQALARCSAVRFDAITLDLILPDMAGLDVLAALRSGGASADARVIVVTVIAEKDVVGAFAVDDVLGKPIDEQALLASLRRAGVSPDKQGYALVVDDDPGSLRLMSATLSQLGYRVVCSPDAPSALRATEQEAPSVVILDLLMPVMDGFEFLRHFRAREENLRIPVIVWTVKDLSVAEYAQLRTSAQGVVIKGRDGTAGLVGQVRESFARNAPAGATHGG